MAERSQPRAPLLKELAAMPPLKENLSFTHTFELVNGAVYCDHVFLCLLAIAYMSRGMNSTPGIESVLSLFTKLQTKTKNVPNECLKMYTVWGSKQPTYLQRTYVQICVQNSSHESSGVLPLNMGSSNPGKRPIFLTGAALALLWGDQGDAIAYKHLPLNLLLECLPAVSLHGFMWLVGIVGLVPRWLFEDAWDLYEWLELVREVSQTSMLNWMQVAETMCSAAILWAANLLVHISCADTNGWVVSWQSSAVRLTMVRKYLSLLSLCACFFPQVTSGGPTKTLCNMVIFSASADFWCHFKPMKIHGAWAH